MNRRDFLKAACRRIAGVGLGAFVMSSIADDALREKDLSEEQQKLSEEEQIKLGVAKLIEEYYDIPKGDTEEAKKEAADLTQKAGELYDRMVDEVKGPAAAGAVMGPCFSMISNKGDIPFFKSGGFIHGLFNIITMPMVVSVAAGYEGGYIDKSLRESSLFDPQVLAEKYGLSQEKAVAFCESWRSEASGDAYAGAFLSTSAYEVVHSFFGRRKGRGVSESTSSTKRLGPEDFRRYGAVDAEFTVVDQDQLSP